MRYEAQIEPAQDAHPENNAGAAWVEVAGGPRVVLVTNYPDDPLAALLGAQGLTWRPVRGWVLALWAMLLVIEAALTRLGVLFVPWQARRPVRG